MFVKGPIDLLDQSRHLVDDGKSETRVYMPQLGNRDDVFSRISEGDIRSVEPNLVFILLEDMSDLLAKCSANQDVRV